ncbi:MAG: GntR family transcriptional regulator [Candidatus Omnitrophica bacterium]|nr:GntR family transcriptional regulator [Candidatus Omnitrophota bacterium]
MGEETLKKFQIIASSGVPIYRQIMDQVKLFIASGELVEGEFLPSVRQVAACLAVNPMTVSKAYSLLEKEGVIGYLRGQGMAVASRQERTEGHLSEQESALAPLVEQVVARAKQLSLDAVYVQNMVERYWKE